MRAVILAAGMASRLRPLTADTPKCLLKIGDRCLLQRSMDALIRHGVRDVVIVTGYLHEKIELFVYQQYADLFDSDSLRVTFAYNAVYESTNNIYSLWLARPFAESEDIILMDSDLLYDPEIIARVLDEDAADVLTLIRHELGEEEMKVVTDAEGRIVEISKTCRAEDAAGESLGIEKMGRAYTKALFAELETMMNTEHLEHVFYERAFERLLIQGHTFRVLDVTAFFSCELDTVQDFENAKETIPASLF